MKYHINKNGVPAICTAQQKACPCGDAGRHYDTQQQAQAAIDKQMLEQYGGCPETEALRGGYWDKSNGGSGLSWHEYSFASEISDHKFKSIQQEVDFCLQALKNKSHAFVAPEVAECFKDLPGVIINDGISFSNLTLPVKPELTAKERKLKERTLDAFETGVTIDSMPAEFYADDIAKLRDELETTEDSWDRMFHNVFKKLEKCDNDFCLDKMEIQ
jgi:hypothetical protein